jgi:hypothetical protein
MSVGKACFSGLAADLWIDFGGTPEPLLTQLRRLPSAGKLRGHLTRR